VHYDFRAIQRQIHISGISNDDPCVRDYAGISGVMKEGFSAEILESGLFGAEAG
jgi:hypothetical protein